MNDGIEVKAMQDPGSNRVTLAVQIDMGLQFMTYSMLERVSEQLAQKAVDEIWKRHGTKIMRRVDKKTIGNLTVKKLSALIAKELKDTK